MILEIKPLDTLFFRDGKPFNKGEETWADAIFPPFPATIYGALRSAYFNENVEIFEKLKNEKKLNTNDDPTTKLRINNIFVKSGNDFLFRCPQNVLMHNEKTELLNVSENNFLSSKQNFKLLINQSNDKFRYEQSFINELDFEDYLKRNSSNYKLIKQLFDFEPKVGIAINSQTRTSDDSNLYRVDMLRLKEDISIVVDFEELNIFGTFIKVGGEGKFVSAKKLDNSIEIPFPKIEDKFLLYFSTPAIFIKGWLPNWIDENSLKGKIPNTNLTVKLLTASIGTPDLIGGFDMAKRRPKSMFKAVPSGSVYFFEIIEGDKNELKKIHQKSISDIYSEQGFGICYVGKY